MRHVVGAMNVLVREDLGYGAVTDWNFTPKEKEECFCNHQFDVKSCSVQGIYKTKDVETNDPESLACGLGKIDLASMFPNSDLQMKPAAVKRKLT